MAYRDIAKILGVYLFFLAGALLVPLGVACYYEFLASAQEHPQPHSFFAFLYTIFFCLGLALVFYYWGKGATGKVFRREGLILVGGIWFITAAIGGMPYVLSGTLDRPIDAYFEAISGLTTTGASVMQAKQYDEVTGKEIPYTVNISGDNTYCFYGTIAPVISRETGEVLLTGVEAVSKAILFWRSFTQWLGGMGIVVLFVAILPALGVGGKVLFQAEVPGPNKDAFTPRIKETAGVLWVIYVTLTALQVIFLLGTNDKMTLFQAVTVSFSTLSTGGFSIHNASIGFYDSPITEWIIIIFMVLGGVNFTLYFHCIRGKFFRLFDAEFILYLIILLCGSGLVAYFLLGTRIELLTGGGDIFSSWDTFRYACFQMVSAQTSTGFATANFAVWPHVNVFFMEIVMFIGAMAGSTGGGIKVIRHYMCFKTVVQRVENIFRPETIRKVMIGGGVVDTKVQLTVLSFFLIVVGLSIFGSILFVLTGMDAETAISVNTCMINNIGLAFGMAGPTESFAFLTTFAKVLAVFWMVLGRLEFFALLILFYPRFWTGR